MTGAIARGVSKERVCPILFGLKKSDLKGPLAFRQSVEFTEDDFRKLLKTINSGRLGEADFKEVFDVWWPKLKESIEAITAAPQPVLKEPSTNELLQEILALTRNVAIEQIRLTDGVVQALKREPQVEAIVRALLRREGKPRPVPGPADYAGDRAEMVGSVAGSLTPKSE